MPTVVMYHYVRDPEALRFPGLKGVSEREFRAQVEELARTHEPASIADVVKVVSGEVRERPVALLTFDDGLKDHLEVVAPILAEHGIAGVFFVIGSALRERCVAAAHLNHVLMGALPFADYQKALHDEVRRLAPALSFASDAERARATYRWDTPEVATFKFLLNFELPRAVRNQALHGTYERLIGSTRELADRFYLDADDVRSLRALGMVIGGHSDSHEPLSALSEAELALDLARCRTTLEDILGAAPARPFSYPFGKRSAFDAACAAAVKRAGFGCAFTTERTPIDSAIELSLQIPRLDPKDVFSRPLSGP